MLEPRVVFKKSNASSLFLQAEDTAHEAPPLLEKLVAPATPSSFGSGTTAQLPLWSWAAVIDEIIQLPWIKPAALPVLNYAMYWSQSV